MVSGQLFIVVELVRSGQDAQSGQTAFKDPVTGKFRNPTALEAKQLNDLRAAQRATAVAARKASGAPQANVVRLQQNDIVAALRTRLISGAQR